MNETLKKLLAALGLADTTTEADAISAVAALQAQAAGAETRIATLTAQAAQAPNPALYVPMSTHSQTQNALAALTAEFEKKERDTLMEVALSDGRILAAQDAYWRAQPVAALKAYLEVAHPVAALAGTQTGGKKPEGEAGSTLDAAQLAMCSAMGIDPKDFAKTAFGHQQSAK